MTAIIDDEKKYFMRNHETGNLYFLTEFGNDLWNIIDGKRTVKEIYEAMDGIYKDLRRDLVTESLIYYAEEGALEAVLEPVKKKRLFIASAFMVRLTLVWESNKFFQSIHRLVRPLLRKPLLWVAVSFVTVMGLLFAGRFVSIFTNKENFEIMGSTVVGFFFYYFAVLAPIIAVHEIAHGLTLFHYGGIPKEIGTGLYYFGPMFYIDVTDGWTLDRYHRIMVFAAGPLSTITIGSLIMAVQYLWQFPASISLILTMATFYCFYGLLIDLSPLLETDGYHILCDVVNIPDLRKKSFTYIKNAARRLIKQPIKDEDEKLTIKTKAILLTYAALAAIWAVYLVFRSLLIVIYMAEDT
ncbi:MAG: PqqD family peptide modification chaperone, partial [Candidatus Bathyarchaeota archaeon]